MEGGGSSSNSCMMGFPGGNSNGLICPMIMMPPPLISSHSNSNAEINSNNHHDQNSHFTSLSPPPPLVLEYHHNIQSKNTSTEGYYFMENIDDHDNNSNNNGYESSACNSSLRDKIIAHPHYRRLLTSYLNCQKIGAPAEVVARLEESCTAVLGAARAGIGCIGEDPTLDQFMEAYSEMLTKYELELSKPFSEAMLFLSRIECQFKALTVDSSQSGCLARNGLEDANRSFVDPHAEDKELKGQLLRKYSGYLGSLKQEFMKKRKRGKLPKEARQQLLEWWNRHYKWPYPSETQKLALAESTGLDQKQINNWFINQRKRHWKPSEDMQLIVMDAAAYPAHCYLQDNVLANPFPVDISSAFL